MKAYKNIILVAVLVFAAGAGGGDSSVSTFTDKRDGKVYRIVKIGSQTWFAENLNYAAGGSKCYENSEDSCAKYGRLYNWETALKACPAGFHLPDVKEWTMLEKNAGGVKKAGTKLKSSTGWERYKNVPAGTDEYGFSALPGGIGVFAGNAGNGEFKSSGEYGGWWTAKGISHDPILGRIWHGNYSPLQRDNAALNRYMMAYEEPISRNYHNRTHTYISVRCVMDKEAQK